MRDSDIDALSADGAQETGLIVTPSLLADVISEHLAFTGPDHLLTERCAVALYAGLRARQ